MKLLALDQASVTSGYSIYVDGKLVEYDKFTYDDSEIALRLVQIRNKVKNLIIKNDIDFVAFEDIQLQENVKNNVQTFKVLSEVYGVILELIKELDLPYEIVLAGTWKSTLGIKGKNRVEQKRAAQQYVLDTFNIKATQDVCDAICIGQHILTKKDKENINDWSD